MPHFAVRCYWVLCAVLLMTNCNPARAADLAPYEAHTYSSAAGMVHYRLLKPSGYSPDEAYPLVLFLHGAGERGHDNRSQLKHVVRTFGQDEVRAKYPCFVVAPQCPPNHLWCNTPWNVDTVVQPAEESLAMKRAMLLLDELQRQCWTPAMQEPELLPWLFAQSRAAR